MPSMDKLKASLATSVIKRENAFAAASTLLKLIKDLTTEVDVANMCLTELVKVEKTFREADELVVQLNSQLEEPGQIGSPSKFEAFFEICLHVRAAHSRLTASTSVKAPSLSSAELPIPRVDLPCFQGKVEEWPGFIALFDALVHQNNSLAPVQKFHLLASAISGEAASVISGFQLNSVNYPLAYQALHSRYQNPRRLANLYVNQILDSRPASVSSLPQLKKFVTTHQNAIHAIKALPISDLADFLLFSLALRNLDIPSRHLFEGQLSSDDFPTLAQLLEFTNRQLRVLESTSVTSSIAPKGSLRPQSPAGSASVSPSSVSSSSGVHPRRPAYAGACPSSSSTCVFCSANHSVRQCREFKAMNVNQRRAFVTEGRLCRNCMSSFHATAKCSSSQSCHTCGGRHHTILHLASAAAASAATASPSVSYAGRKSLSTAERPSSPSVSSEEPTRAVTSRGTSMRARSAGISMMSRRSPEAAGSVSSRASPASPPLHSSHSSGSGSE
ncbi:uncharacterized protein LOC123682468 [Harmonia axyridis]|uniref:uncharacterized protein LOC123682468 n=1 Tax=Harmonia axyridis TaxID=115357 RepID=UPI001E276DAF|nr:uncharacterized protein LOC123682468 [Harmonia axyridis]